MKNPTSNKLDVGVFYINYSHIYFSVANDILAKANDLP